MIKSRRDEQTGFDDLHYRMFENEVKMQKLINTGRCLRITVCRYRIAALRAAIMFSSSNMVYRLCKDMVDTYLVK